MITKKELKILGTMKKLYKEYSFKEIKELSKEKSNSLLQKALKRFVEQELVIKRKISNLNLYKLNQENKLVVNYLEIYNYENLNNKAKTSIKLLEKELKEIINFYSIIIFGSFATGKKQEDSDLDLAIIVPSGMNKETIKEIEIAINNTNKKSLLTIDGHIISVDELVEMLKSKKANLGKEIVNENLPIKNGLAFYNIILQANK